ncbi:MAG: tyrosine-type recombinase/integrase [Chloroflexi bacterium]|nr:tyrosine-type recombinase/integrase [Chloroflexota bacterium]
MECLLLRPLVSNFGSLPVSSYIGREGDSPYPQVFLNQYGAPISDRGIRKLIAKYRRKAGITKKASPHSLRHTFATAKAEKGVSPFQLKEWLGHSSLNTTQIYVHMARKNAKKVMEATSL